MDSNLNTLKILKSINNLKRYFINIGDSIKGLENLDLFELAKQGDNQEATNSAIYDAINAISPDLVQGKERLATAITSKGVETTSADSLSQMAKNVDSITNVGIIENISTINESVTILNDSNKGWTLTNNANYLFTLYPNLKELHFGFINYTTQVLSVTSVVTDDLAKSYDIDIIFDEIETLDIRDAGIKNFISFTNGSGVKGARCHFPKLKTIYFPGNYYNRINVEKVFFPILKSGTYYYSGSASYNRTLIKYIYIGCMGEKTDTININCHGQDNNSVVNNIIIELRDGACQNLSFKPQSNVVTLTEDNICTYILKKLKQDEPLCGDGVTITFGAANLANLTSDESIELLDKLTNIYGYTFA